MKIDFKQDHEQFVNQYVKGIESLANIGYMEREKILEKVNAKTWYLLRFLYGDDDRGDSPPPCIM